MEKMRVLIANKPHTYREAITDALRERRPHVEVSTVDPDGLDAEIASLRPQLVVCSEPCGATENGALTWVVLYPSGENRAEIITLGERTTLDGIGFGDLLSIIDDTELLNRSAQDGRQA